MTRADMLRDAVLLQTLFIASIASGQIQSVPQPTQGVGAAQPGGPANPPRLGPSAQPGTIEGVAVDSSGGVPVNGATVTLRNVALNDQRAATTDAAGKFRFVKVDPGSYTVATATAQGYVYQPAVRGGRSAVISVAENQNVTGIKVQFQRLGVIAGRVRDENGDPLVGANVQALRVDFSRDNKALALAGSATADDRGAYRIFDLRPGRYAVRVSFRVPTEDLGETVNFNVPELGYAPAYYPSGNDSSGATMIQVSSGSEVVGVDYQLSSAVVYHVRGNVVGDLGSGGATTLGPCVGTAAVAGASLRLSSPLRQGGAFDFGNVFPGTYCVTYRSSHGKLHYASERVTVTESNVVGIILREAALNDIQGRLRAEGAVPEGLTGSSVVLLPVGDLVGAASATVAADGAFPLVNVGPGHYQVYVQGLPKGLYVKSMEYNTQDISDGIMPVTVERGALTIRLDSDGGKISGVVETGAGDPAPGSRVIIAPDDRLAMRRDLVKVGRTDEKGRFQVANVAPGEYKVFAVDAVDNSEANFRSADYRKAFERGAQGLTVHSGGDEHIQLEAIGADEVLQITGGIQ